MNSHCRKTPSPASILALLLSLALPSCTNSAPTEHVAVVSGSVLTPTGEPIAGLTVRVDHTSASTSSNASGSFELAGIPVSESGTSRVTLVFDASTGSPPSTFRMSMPVELTASQRLDLALPIHVPMSDASSATRLHGLSTQTVLTPGHPGASLQVAPGQTAFDSANGGESARGTLAMVHIPRHLLPGALPNGMVSDVIFSIQPSGVVFDPPASITFPNYDGFAPRENVPIMQVSPVTAEWVQVGTATVNNAGTLIVSDPGSGVLWGSCTGCCYPPCRATIEGVVERESGARVQPVEGARVRAGGGAQATTDAAGRYRLENVPIGNCATTQGPFDVEVVAYYTTTNGAVLTQERSVSLSNGGTAQVDFLFQSMTLRFVDDENDGTLSVGTEPSSFAGAPVDTVAADGSTSVAIAFLVGADPALENAFARVWIDEEASDPGEPGELILDTNPGDGLPGVSEGATQPIPLPDLLQGRSVLRYAAPARLGTGSIDPADGRESRRVRLSAQVFVSDAGERSVLYDMKEPAEIRLVHPQLFFVHGLLADGFVWARQTLLQGGGFHPFEYVNSLCQGGPLDTTAFEERLAPVMGRTPYAAYVADYSAQSGSSRDVVAPIVRQQLHGLDAMLRNAGIASTSYDVIAHSYGGLVTRRLIEEFEAAASANPAVARRIRGLVTLGTPHLGSTMSDRVRNLTEPEASCPGATAMREELLATLDDSGLDSYCTSAPNNVAAIQAMLTPSSVPRTAYDETSSAYRMQSGFAREGFVEGVRELFLYGITNVLSSANDALYGGMSSWTLGNIESPGDFLVSTQSATAGNNPNSVDLPGLHHSELPGLDHVEVGIAFLHSPSVPEYVPVQDASVRGPVILRVNRLEVPTTAFSGDPSYDFRIQGRGFGEGGVAVVFPTGHGPVSVVPPAEFVDDTEIRFRYPENPVPGGTFPASTTRAVPGFVRVELGNVRSNSVYVNFGYYPSAPDLVALSEAALAAAGSEPRVSALVRHPFQTLAVPVVTLAGVTSPNVTVVSTVPVAGGSFESVLEFTLPAETTAGDVVVRDGLGPVSNPLAWSVTPTLTSVAPALAEVGALVRIEGTHFGAIPDRVEVRIGGVLQSLVSVEPQRIAFVLSDGTASGRLEVFVSGVPASGDIQVAVAVDSDRDGMPDPFELDHALDPFDPVDAGGDPDGDGLVNVEEYRRRTDPRASDSDRGGLQDGLEVALGLDPTDPVDDVGDVDGDGLSTTDELERGTDPSDADTDDDLLTDGDEVTGRTGFITNPLDVDTDDDGLGDGFEILVYFCDPTRPDSDFDGLGDAAEIFGTYGWTTSATDPDSDDDGLSDGDEVLVYGTDPLDADTDGDGLLDGAEIDVWGTDPTDEDSDDDHLSDGLEVDLNTDPSVADPLTRIEGRVEFADGGAASGASVRLAAIATDYFSTTAGSSGAFVIQGFPAALSPVTVVAILGDLEARSAPTTCIPGGVTHVGTLVLATGSALPPYPCVDLLLEAEEHALADVDRDGSDDLILIEDDRVVLRRGLGAARFAPPITLTTLSGLSSIVAADLDRDGWTDLAASTFGYGIRVLWNDGAGSFPTATSAPLPTYGFSITTGRMDADPGLDLVLCDYFGNVTVLPSRGRSLLAAVSRSIGTQGGLVVTGDVDGDGLDDVAAALGFYGDVAVLRNLGDAQLSQPQIVATGQHLQSLLLDLDADGLADLVTGSANQVRVFRALGGSAFQAWQTFPLAANGGYLAAADFDRDGSVDVAASDYALDYSVGWGSRISTFHGSSTGILTPWGGISVSAFGSFDLGRPLVVGDVNGDGSKDITARGSEELGILVNHGDGTFGTLRTRYVPSSASAFAAADFDGDGDTDVVVAHSGSTYISKLWNEGGVLSEAVTETMNAGTREVAAGRIDADALPDLLLAGGSAGIAVARNDGSGGFLDAVLLAAGGSFSAPRLADFDGDGRLDVLALLGYDSIAVFRNLGNGSFGSFFQYPLGFANTWILQTGDIDVDGLLDVVAVSTGSAPVVLRNQGAFVFGPPVSLVVPGDFQYLTGLTLGDFDADGRADLCLSQLDLATYTWRLQFLRNAGQLQFSPTDSLAVEQSTYLHDLHVCDVNEDGRPDVIGRDTSNHFGLALGRGDGTFAWSHLFHAGAGDSVQLGVAPIDGSPGPEVLLLDGSFLNVASREP